MIEFDAVYGVDFSAAARDAGRNTWIAECTPAGEQLVVDDIAEAANAPGCDPDRDATLDHLVHLIAGDADERRAFGLDFPFGLPRALTGEEGWHEFVSGVRERDQWGELGEVDGPQALYDGARSLAVDADVRLRRETDEEHGGQEPTGFRIKTQTYYGISSVLAPVAGADGVSVVPMDDGEGEAVVIETYPAAAFRGLRAEVEGPVHDRGYKRDTRESIERRRENVDALDSAGVGFGYLDEFAVASDHALDAVAAAYATWQAVKDGDPREEVTDETGKVDCHYETEGYIYC